MKKNNSIKNKILAIISMFVMSTFVLSACDFDELLSNLFNTITIIPPIEQVEPDDETVYEEIEQIDVINNPTVVTGLTLQSTSLLWDEVEGQENYYVAIYSNSTDPTIMQVPNNMFSFNTLLETYNEIYAFRVGIKNEQNDYELSNVTYYNPVSFTPYTSSVYYFNGTLADYYITSQQELNHLAHYSFIYRISELTVKFSNEFYNSISSLSDALYEAYNESFMETISLSYSSTIVSSSNNIIRLNLNFNGAVEPTLTLQKTMQQDTKQLPYYETVNYLPREATYDNFKTDQSIILSPVESGEELFWAVESNATPIFNSETSSAYRIYNKAKDVLREIISDDMTDYEKLLSIFDYITVNTVYDYQIVNDGTSVTGSNPFTAYTSFYLEGVFDDGLAVCDGFSKAFSLLANMEGIKTVRIVGDAGGGHAWNKTYLYGNWYVVDITWTELEMLHYETEQNTEYLAHKYFLVSDNEIETHTAHSTQSYKDFTAANNYFYYTQTKFTYNEIEYDAVIDSNADAIALLNYLWENFQNEEIITSLEVVMTTTITNNWGTIVRGVKDDYNAENVDRFDNDVLKVIDGSYNGTTLSYVATLYSENLSGIVSIVQIHDTFLNLQQ